MSWSRWLWWWWVEEVKQSVVHQHCLFLTEVQPSKLACYHSAPHIIRDGCAHFVTLPKTGRLCAKTYKKIISQLARGIERLPFQLPEQFSPQLHSVCWPFGRPSNTISLVCWLHLQNKEKRVNIFLFFNQLLPSDGRFWRIRFAVDKSWQEQLSACSRSRGCYMWASTIFTVAQMSKCESSPVP